MTLGFYSDGTNTVIAHDIEDAKRVYEETVGSPWTPASDRPEDMWRTELVGGPIALYFETADDVPAFARERFDRVQVPFDSRKRMRVTLTPAEWIDAFGRVLFSTTEAT